MGTSQGQELTSRRHTAPLRRQPEGQHLPVNPRLSGEHGIGVQKGLQGRQ